MINFVGFSKFVGEMDTCPDDFLSKVDGTHIIKQVGVIYGEQYYMNSNQDYQDMVDLILLLEDRGAVRGVDFFVGCYTVPHTDGNSGVINVVIHTHSGFVSDEDIVK